MEFRDLAVRHVDWLPATCSGCVYWEFPHAFDEGVPAEKARAMKAEWVARYAGCPVGRVALSGDSVVGFVQFGPPELFPRRLEYDCGPVSKDAFFVTCLFVEPSSRGIGLARRLLEQAREVARDRGYAAVETFARRGSSNNPSGPVELYEACGFHVVRDGSEFPLVRRALAKIKARSE